MAELEGGGISVFRAVNLADAASRGRWSIVDGLGSRQGAGLNTGMGAALALIVRVRMIPVASSPDRTTLPAFIIAPGRISGKPAEGDRGTARHQGQTR